MKYLVCLAALALVSPGAMAAEKKPKVSKQHQRLYAMTPQQFQASARLKDDALETVATITTEEGFQEKQGLLGMVNSDHFFRAFIDKKTGATTYQIYKYVQYYGEWAFIQQVNYETPNGPVSASVDVLSRDVGTCTNLLGCLHKETVAWDVDEQLLRWIASRYAPGQQTIWQFRLKAKSGAQADYGFVPAEVAGLLLAVDEYKRQRGLTRPTPAAESATKATADSAAAVPD